MKRESLSLAADYLRIGGLDEASLADPVRLSSELNLSRLTSLNGGLSRASWSHIPIWGGASRVIGGIGWGLTVVRTGYQLM